MIAWTLFFLFLVFFPYQYPLIIFGMADDAFYDFAFPL